MPGQETKPSGYAEYLANHQDRPWETLSYAPPFDAVVGKQHNSVHPQTVAYDDPYDRSAGESQNGLTQLGFYAKNTYADPHSNHNGTDSGQTLTLEQELSQVKLKQQTIESYLPQLQVSNGLDQVTGASVNGHKRGEEEEEKRGLIASQPASIQTDTLSPASERELLSYPLPKSDIAVVVGHGREDTERKLHAGLDTEGKTVDNGTNTSSSMLARGTDTIYAAANSIDRQQQVDGGLASANDASVAADPRVCDAVSNLSQTADLTATGMETETTWVHGQNVADCNDCDVVKENSLPFSEGSVLCDGLAANLSTVTNSLQQEMAAAGFEAEEKPPTSSDAVGFGTDEGCEMDGDEVEAYLQDLEGGSSMSGDDADRLAQAAAVSVSPPPPPTQEDAAQNGGVPPRLSEEEDVVMADEPSSTTPAASVGNTNSACVSDSAAGSVSGEGSVGDDAAAGGSGIDAVDSLVGDSPPTSTRAEGVVDSGVVMESKDCPSDVTRNLNSSVLDVKQPDVVADISHRATDTPPVANMHMEQHAVDTDQKTVVRGSDGVANLDHNRPADNAPLGFPVTTNPTEMNLSLSTDRQAGGTSSEFPVAETTSRQAGGTSLDFPVTGNDSELSCAMKGKLEIEGLLDEIVSARRAQKSAELSNADAAPAPVGTQDASPVVLEQQTVLRDGGSGVKSRAEGWGPEGSMVCSLARKPQSGGSPAESGSPSPTMGVGARPKDPSQMKKNRPNSLLGLSKISLGSPFSPPQQQGVGPVIGVVLPSAQKQQGGEGGGRTAALPPPQTEPGDADGGEARAHPHSLGVRRLGAPPSVTTGAPAPDISAAVPANSAPAPSAVETSAMEEEDEVEAAVMRRPEVSGEGGTTTGGEGGEASSGGQRPRSWSPSSMSSPPQEAQKMKRPTSLNLPVRQDRVGSVSPDGDNARSRKADFMQEAGLASETGSSGQLVKFEN